MITVLGAGSVGCHIGGMLAAAGHPVVLIGRPQLVQDLSEGLQVSTLDGAQHHARPTVTADPGALARATLILLCVKSADTEDAAKIIAQHAPPDIPVISLQNGVTNTARLAEVLGPDRVVAGMVGYNVVRRAPDHFAQTTDGEVILAPAGAALRDLLADTPITARCHPDMPGVQWSKLLLNLNNALNALSGLPLREQLQDRGWRRVLAACIAEGLDVAQAEGIHLERIGKLHPRALPFLLRLPNFIFRRLAQPMLRIDPVARSSMADDYAVGRASEVSWLNGHIVMQARAMGIAAPVNAKVCALVSSAFADKTRPPLHATATAVLN